jgi:hypothetical protein
MASTAAAGSSLPASALSTSLPSMGRGQGPARKSLSLARMRISGSCGGAVGLGGAQRWRWWVHRRRRDPGRRSRRPGRSPRSHRVARRRRGGGRCGRARCGRRGPCRHRGLGRHRGADCVTRAGARRRRRRRRSPPNRLAPNRLGASHPCLGLGLLGESPLLLLGEAGAPLPLSRVGLGLGLLGESPAPPPGRGGRASTARELAQVRRGPAPPRPRGTRPLGPP